MLIERVLVPLDGSLLAEQILPYVRRMRYRNDSEIILVHAAVVPPVENALLIADTLLASGSKYILGMQERLVQEGVRVKSLCRIGSAPRVILEAAEEEKATMLAFATHGETGLNRLLMGSVAETMMRMSPVPVFVVRPFWSYELLPGSLEKKDLQPIRNILLPVAGSNLDLAALSPVIEFARLFESRVVLLHVNESGTKGDKDPLGENQEGLAVLVACARRLEGEGVETLSLIEGGEPVDVILKVARSQKTDLIAMATHGRTGIDRLFRGSMTEKILHESPCPMLVVKSPDPAERKSRPLEIRGTRK